VVDVDDDDLAAPGVGDAADRFQGVRKQVPAPPRVLVGAEG